MGSSEMAAELVVGEGVVVVLPLGEAASAEDQRWMTVLCVCLSGRVG